MAPAKAPALPGKDFLITFPAQHFGLVAKGDLPWGFGSFAVFSSSCQLIIGATPSTLSSQPGLAPGPSQAWPTQDLALLGMNGSGQPL